MSIEEISQGEQGLELLLLLLARKSFLDSPMGQEWSS